jgi:hypothetical protein
MCNVDEDSPPHSGPDLLAKRALDALGAECQIPPDLEEAILARVLDGPPAVAGVESPEAPPVAEAPVVKVGESRPAPLSNVIRLGREDERRWKWLGPGAAVAAFALAASITLLARPAPHRGVAPRPSAVQMRGSVPGGFHGRAVPDDHRRLAEARLVLYVGAQRAENACRAGTWSAVVLFEHSGETRVLEVAGGAAKETACLREALVLARVSPSTGGRLVVQLDQRGGARAARGWLVDET